MTSNITILLQGNIRQETYDFYAENYKNTQIVISTWDDAIIKVEKSLTNIHIIKNKLPLDTGPQNVNLQLISTLNGLSNINTKYTIKIRGDEIYSNLNYIYSLILSDDDLIYTSPVFFRKWNSHYQYHISDHMIAGSTSNLLDMFNTSKINFDSNEYDYKYTSEILLGKSYLDHREGCILSYDDSNKIFMKKYFSIVQLEKLKPYKIVANAFNMEWYNNFNIFEYDSISNISEI